MVPIIAQEEWNESQSLLSKRMALLVVVVVPNE
jgi:hypothetical protein